MVLTNCCHVVVGANGGLNKRRTTGATQSTLLCESLTPTWGDVVGQHARLMRATWRAISVPTWPGACAVAWPGHIHACRAAPPGELSAARPPWLPRGVADRTSIRWGRNRCSALQGLPVWANVHAPSCCAWSPPGWRPSRRRRRP